MGFFSAKLFLSLHLPDLRFNVSLMTSRLELVKENIHNFSLLLHQPIHKLQIISNGETAIGPSASYNMNVRKYNCTNISTMFSIRLICNSAASSPSGCSSTLQHAGGTTAAPQTPTAAAEFFFCGGKYQQHSKGDQSACDSHTHCRLVNTFRLYNKRTPQFMGQ